MICNYSVVLLFGEFIISKKIEVYKVGIVIIIYKGF